MADYINLSKQLINRYCLREFNECADFSDMEEVCLAFESQYTAEGHKQYTHVFLDMLTYSVYLYCDGFPVRCVNLRNPEGVYDFCCGSLNFDYLLHKFFNDVSWGGCAW